MPASPHPSENHFLYGKRPGMGGGVKLQQCRHALGSRSPFVKRMDDARAETVRGCMVFVHSLVALQWQCWDSNLSPTQNLMVIFFLFYSLRKWYFVAILPGNFITDFHLLEVLVKAFFIQEFVFRGLSTLKGLLWLDGVMCPLSCFLPMPTVCPPLSSVTFSWLCRTNLYPFNVTWCLQILLMAIYLDTSRPQPHRR